MDTHADKKLENKSRTVANEVAQKKSSSESTFQFVDNRPEAIAQRKMQDIANDYVENRESLHTETTQNTYIQLKRKNNIGSYSNVLQLKKKWTKAKAEKYKKHLRRRAAKRLKKGKKKNSRKLVEKYVNARRSADPNFRARLADTPSAGHHVPPLAVSNNQNGTFAFGDRGSAEERGRDRVYFDHAQQQEREEAHWLAHEAEGMQGVNRDGTFQGDSQDLANAVNRAHHGLALSNGQPIRVQVQNQNDQANGATVQSEELGIGTRRLMEDGAPDDLESVHTDSTDSSATLDSDKWKTDSDEE